MIHDINSPSLKKSSLTMFEEMPRTPLPNLMAFGNVLKVKTLFSSLIKWMLCFHWKKPNNEKHTQLNFWNISKSHEQYLWKVIIHFLSIFFFLPKLVDMFCCRRWQVERRNVNNKKIYICHKLESEREFVFPQKTLPKYT